MQQACDNYRQFLETLTTETLPELPKFVSAQVHFRDPFNDVRGIDAMTEIFRHMFEAVGPVKFTVYHAQATGKNAVMSWSFEGRLFGKPWVFNDLVAAHIDHWDAARHFYERLPLIGWLLAWLRRRLATQ